MKKDIWATITFLTTGVLFYLSQVVGTPQKTLSSGEGFEVKETVVMEEQAPETTADPLLGNPRTRDS